ncbi:cache domain-containing sensor histidine kinase [Candidatus Acetatifactor stercoripullorum]|uniref:cache domain-containing sensor histidine kinase n=1 Tax=Candidatus Acetatifactor stercoripullorum TaxID=2838414 RepID=UPI00298ECCD1|nr:sensor histidine kinase [Candidatus Acetatifactor stercoripullorum]
MKKSNLSLSHIITMLVVSLVTIIILSTAFVFMSVYVNSMEENAATSSEQTVVQVSNTVGNYIEDMKEIMTLIEESYRMEKEEREDTLKTLTNVRSDLVAIYVYDENAELLSAYTGKYDFKENYLKNLSYVEAPEYEQGAIYISKPHVESMLVNEYPWVVSVLQEIEGENGKKNRVVIDIRFSKISDYVDDVGIGRHGYCFITDMDGEIIYHPQQQLIYSGLKSEPTADVMGRADGSYQEQQVIYAVKTLDNYGWRVVGVSYINELVTAKETEVFGIVIVILVIIFFVTFVSSYIMSCVVSKPIQKLVNDMGEFEKNAAGYSYSPMGGIGEIQFLSQSFGHMVKRIQSLMNQVRQEEITLRKTELKALQAQINPHFLYNTLDSIGWLCEEERSRDAVEMVNALAKLFRISISKGHELITVEKELEHARSYLKIQKFRYKNQFNYEFQVEEGCLSYYCNKITLQPIIENAIYHGLNRMVDEGQIVVRAYTDGRDMVFEVEDNGVGMTKEQCRSILQKEPGESAGIGIKNVNDRIQIYFGESYGIQIESELDEGTTVRIRMPKLEREDVETYTGSVKAPDPVEKGESR